MIDRSTAVPRVLLVAIALLVGCATSNDVSVTQARLIAPLPGQSTAVAYFSLHNATEADPRLIGARSTAAGAIEIHTHVRDGDMLRMRPLASVDIPARSAIDFAPGGHHLMVFRYTGPRTGTVEIELQFQDHVPVSATFAVEERSEHTQ